ncbi:GntR family transcriptional regulator [Flexivirga sp. ID2601S]|uniref:GntR family transcriptional regulator n=1 Tax=Flexivirga aerilata TaxID=1656889 RepID=A0A849AB66_9MICO|nr:GntR family transcriptional regulator [Flexivirga aerilata]NNG37765.1 GntR family transcriptional regulator [Flexivirga aerilata]
MTSDDRASDLSGTAPRQKASAVYEDLRTRILGGRLECGVWLRAESLADELGVSRTPVREAFRQLAADGLIELIPNRGARVALISDEDLESTYELHAILEGYGARRAAEGQLADIGRLRELCDLMERTLATGEEGKYDEITRLDLEFHGAIHRASGNIALPAMIAGFAQRSLVRNAFADYAPAEIERALDQHREITEAVGARDGVLAEAIMRSHVLGARTTLRRGLAKLTEPCKAPAS